MGYQFALKAAGAEVIVFEEFGSYQGEWWAKVFYLGRTGWVSGSYGSCSGCDAFESEFGNANEERCKQHRYDSMAAKDCVDCATQPSVYQTKLAKFGAEYLDAIMTQASAEAYVEKNISWDLDASKMLDFLKRNA